jgi:prepilin-type N-terminal cleavage/methylation domain-containing protein
MKGFTLIEIVITIFVLSVVAVGVFSLITLTLKVSHDSQRRLIATKLANEKMETIRNLPYANIGTLGGIPAGSIAQMEDVTRNSASYTIATDIRYVDDPYDGTATSSPVDLVNADYKQVRVEVTWAGNIPSRSVLLISQITPNGLEGGNSLGTLVFQALNAAGVGVASASVHVVNSAVTPGIDIATSTNNDGLVVLPGLPVSSGAYQLSVSKDGYATEQTYTATGAFTPDVDHSHITTIAGSVTNKTFFIDQVSSLALNTVSALNVPIGSIAFTIAGTKKIGTDASSQPVYLFQHQDTTDESGAFSYEGMTWDSYTFSIDGAGTGYDIKDTSVPLPIVMSPGTSTALTVTLVPYTSISLHVTVLSSDNQPIENAQVHITGTTYDQTIQTSISGQAFFPDMPYNGDYTVDIIAGGHQFINQQVTVSGSTRITSNMASL